MFCAILVVFDVVDIDMIETLDRSDVACDNLFDLVLFIFLVFLGLLAHLIKNN
jgi:hypothetical protein